ncbi:ABC transporter ATP-binding protein [Paracoccus seriniphilus]|uniref:Amino acid/amide ABC transporter ATP-binding protein 1, HAAT family n=1 Tax=Paracoccus seriniphilus TaxID=184748 RepID=A0A239Q0P0_9RHOB|nr:ATP-binding cassette domain-containing protein [Paracoccus seriniphilus]WCR15781.1 ATP-binding cassette domain-containing protein [Paracoccus seriniphilus]SNT76169.1 amino acid/amide ABC transporter ATP-binding protein 1, HAAT family [Paracoccus seriniphilus]
MSHMSLENVTMKFGPFRALTDLSFHISRGEILGVAGPNGAGKSTLMDVCTGGLKASAGEVIFDGRTITSCPRHVRCGLGIAQTFQIPTLLSSLTVGENLLAGHLFGHEARGTPSGIALEEILSLTRLGDHLDMDAARADLLTRKRIMLGAALATGPEIIFMDEPLGGLNSEEIAEFLDVVRHVRDSLGVTVVMVEHKTRALAEIADRILIINFGEFVMLDTPSIVLNDDHVVEIYLGKKHDA